jgi:2-oxoglutarate ferredoxin oxidoreductase subunit delta
MDSVRNVEMQSETRPLDGASKARKRVKIDIDINRCKGCGFCAEFCPLGVLKMSHQRSPKGYDMVKVVDPDKCRGCGICEAICPDFAIRLSAADKEDRKESAAHAE